MEHNAETAIWVIFSFMLLMWSFSRARRGQGALKEQDKE